MTVYAWKPKAGIPVDPQVAGETVEMLRKRMGGMVAPAHLLEHARQSNCPLHAAFEWNDSEAAEQYRLQQAGHILRSLVVNVTFKPQQEERPVRAFHSVVGPDDRRGYTSLAVAMSEQEYRAQIVAQAWRELQSWREKYAEYAELAKAHAAIDAARAQQVA